jgi:Cytochrome c7 and related cytochrome c/Class III cytochrome C family
VRVLKSWKICYLIFIALACAGTWALVGAAFSPGFSGAHEPSQGVSSGVYTSGHTSILAAAKDYFGGYPHDPAQPIAFNHKAHLARGLTCELCHAGAATGAVAGIPSVKFCMACHLTIDKDKPAIQKIAAYYRRGEEIPWVPVYAYNPTAHLEFNHAPHIRAKVACSTCHGDLSQQTTAVRAVNLTMGRCIDCHRQRRVSVDCTTCHY